MAKQVNQIVENLVGSFREHGGINHLDGANLPSRDAVVELTQELLRLVFPGFYDKKPIHSNEVKAFTTELVEAVTWRLESEIRKSLEYRPCDGCDRRDLAGTAVRVTREFLAELPAVRAVLQTDVVAAYEGDPAAISTEEVILAYPGVEAIAVQRMAHVLYQWHVALIPRIMTEWAHNKTGIDIHPGAQIGPSFFMDHGTGVVIGETSVIGRNVRLYQGVTLGAKSFPKDAQGRVVKGIKRHPNIEDRVIIYAGATILGDVTIGHDSIIGGNVWLLESVPANTVVYSEGGQNKMKTTARERDKMVGHTPPGVMEPRNSSGGGCDPKTCDCYGADFLQSNPALVGNRVYADYNATSPIHPEVLTVMLPFLQTDFGNASSVHQEGRDARAAIDEARSRLARLLSAEESEIVFTSGGTEADNLALFGIGNGHVITSRIEHHAVLHAAEQREARGRGAVTFLPVGHDCLVDPDDLKKAIRSDTALVSIMSANNETGAIQPVKELAAVCRERGVLFHTDAVQSFGKEPVRVADWGVDLLSISAHKFGGPKGVGALFVRRGTKLEAQAVGGSHENERRAGTENVAGIVGLACAAELAAAKLTGEAERLRKLTKDFVTQVQQKISGVRRNGHAHQRIANTVNLSFEGCASEGLLVGLDLEGVAVSSGAACAVGSLQPSHVLMAMGLPVEQARAAVRFSFGAGTTEAETNYIVEALLRVVTRLRQFTPA